MVAFYFDTPILFFTIQFLPDITDVFLSFKIAMLFITLEGFAIGYNDDFIGVGVFANVVTDVGAYVQEYARLVRMVIKLVSTGLP